MQGSLKIFLKKIAKKLILRLIYFANDTDVGMVQGRGRFGFVDEALLLFLSLAKVRRQKLDGDEAVHPVR